MLTDIPRYGARVIAPNRRLDPLPDTSGPRDRSVPAAVRLDGLRERVPWTGETAASAERVDAAGAATAATAIQPPVDASRSPDGLEPVGLRAVGACP